MTVLLRPGDRIGDWVVEASLGEGGMGAVYRVHSTLSERLLAALKLLKPTPDPDARARFVREAEALSALSHPSIVRVMGFSEDPARGALYLVMELAVGETLRQRFLRGALPLPEALHTFVPLADALHYAHGAGIFHRDVKPSNIVLCLDGAIKLVDFGIATAEDWVPLTRGGHLGTLAYVPPEAFQGLRPDPAAVDVYGFGVCLQEALTGRPAFPVERGVTAAAGAAAVAGRKLSQGALDPGPEFPAVIREAVRLATDPDPSVRPSMGQILERLASLTRSRGRRSVDRRPTDEADATRTVRVSRSGPAEHTVRVPEPDKPAFSDPVPAWWGRTQRRIAAAHPRALALWAAAALGAVAIIGLGARGCDTKGVTTGVTSAAASAPGAVPEPGAVRRNPQDGLEYAWIPPGAFEMGCTPRDPLCNPAQLPSRPIHLDDGFWLGRTEVTVDAWRRFAEDRGRELPDPAPSFNRGWAHGDHPIVDVRWLAARDYCAWAGGRLPTEAEWEWAARGGDLERFHPWGNEDPVCREGAPNGARFDDDGACSTRGTAAVASYGPNGYGLFDMAGNAWEWTEDAWVAGFDATPTDGGPAMSDDAARRVIRGGSWVNEPHYMRVSIRSRWAEHGPSRDFIGVRCVLDELD